MIFYRPTDGDVYTSKMAWKPRTCFVMSQLSDPVPADLVDARRQVDRIASAADYGVVDAQSLTTGKDYLLKIWHLAASCPVGIAIVHEETRPETLANIYYELGLMQAYGRETIVVNVRNPKIPSDFVRTEYVPFDSKFKRRFGVFIDSLSARAKYYLTLSGQLENDPLLAIDYLRRAYILTGNESLKRRAKRVFENAGLANRGRNSVERQLSAF